MRKFLLSLVVSLALAFSPAVSVAVVKAGPQAPRGFAGKVANSVFALYASSASAGVKDRFICTATAIAKVDGGYELLSAGHCTPANVDELPSDMTFSVATDLGGPLMPVALVKSVMDEPNDWAVFYFPTDRKFPVMKMGDTRKVRVGDKTLDVNFSLALVKEYSEGVVSSQPYKSSNELGPDAVGDFDVDMFASNGSSGSSVIDLNRGKKVVGIVIFGINGRTMPVIIEPISNILPQIKNLKMPKVTSAQLTAQQESAAKAAADDNVVSVQYETGTCSSVMQKALAFKGQPFANFEKVYGEPFSVATGYSDGTIRNAYNFHFNGDRGYIQFDVITKDGAVTDVWEDACGMGGSNIVAPSLPVSQESFWQRGRVAPRSPRQSEPRQPVVRRPERPQPPRERRPEPRETERREPRHAGRDHRSRVDRHRDVRVVGSYTQVYCGGVWLSPYGEGAWMPWVFTDQVYLVSFDGGVTWFIADYDSPGLFQVVVIVE